MSTRSRLSGRYLGYVCTAVVLGGAIIGTNVPVAQSAESAQTLPIVRVEEDWQLVLNEPRNSRNSPQFHTLMSPFDHTDSYYGQVLWNYREVPGFTPGGLQLSAWDGETKLNSRVIRTQQLSTTAETITWTQALYTDGSTLSFEVFNGRSTTWGAFDRDMRIDSYASLPDLDSYSPATTVQNSCVTYGLNRVDSMQITQVRYFDSSGSLVAVDSFPRTVCESNTGGN